MFSKRDGAWFADGLRLCLLSLHLLHLEFSLAISVVFSEIAILAESFRIMQFLSVLTQPGFLLLRPLPARVTRLVVTAEAIAVCEVSPVLVSAFCGLVLKAILQFQCDFRVRQIVLLFILFAVVF